MTEPRPAPSHSAAGLAARLAVQAAALREALRRREQRAAADGLEHDHGLHHLANRLLAIIADDIVPEQPPADDTVARLIHDAEPLREALLLREDAATAAGVREVDWELHSLADRVLTVAELLEVNYPHVTPAGPRNPYRSMRDLVVDAVATWPNEQRVRVAAVLADAGVELPQPRSTAAGHRCDRACQCPVHGIAMYYSPAGGLHACQSPNCVYAQGISAEALAAAVRG